MKVVLKDVYAWKNIEVMSSGTDSNYYKDFIVEMPQKDVLEILRIQVEFGDLQQRLKPLYEALEEAVKTRKETEEAAKEAEEAVKAAEETFPNAEDLARLERPI